MTSEYKKQILLVGPVDEVMELSIEYFRRLGYDRVAQGEPHWVRLKKSTGRGGPAKGEMGRDHTLALMLHSINDKNTNAVFHFESKGFARRGNWSAAGVKEADRIVSYLGNLLSVKFEEPKLQTVQAVHPGKSPEKELIVEREVVVKVKCRYCGALNDQMVSKCTRCGGSV